jgi:threonine synthase
MAQMTEAISFFNTRNPVGERVDLSEAVLGGQPDIISPGETPGLWLPQTYPQFSTQEMKLFQGEDGFVRAMQSTLDKFSVGLGLDRDELMESIKQAFTFSPQLIKINGLGDNAHLLDLNTGPTNAFKDYGATGLNILMETFLRENDEKKTIIVATSGDTGAAVANACKSVEQNPNIQVVVLFPRGLVSEEQRLLMTTLPHDYPNIHCVAVDSKGGFDDCQAMVKNLLGDRTLSGLTTANSINIARILAQAAYYTWTQAQFLDQKPVVSIPSGNLGNLTGAKLSEQMGGLNPTKLLIGQNMNGSTRRLILYEEVASQLGVSVQTLSSAMDISKPSNLERMLYLYGARFNEKGEMAIKPNYQDLQRDFYAQEFDDRRTITTMRRFARENNGKQICPHTAISMINARRAATSEHPEYLDGRPIVVASTANIAKFSDTGKAVYGSFLKPTDEILAAQRIRGEKGEKYTTAGTLQDVREYLICNDLVQQVV